MSSTEVSSFGVNRGAVSFVLPHSVAPSVDISVSDDSDDQSWHSPFDSTAGESYEEGRFSGEIEGMANGRRDYSASECSSEVDLESGDLEMKVHLGKVNRDCRICHLGSEDGVGGGGERETEVPIELGCHCKGDLGAAHKQCAETWFKIKGNTICEICEANAVNVGSEQTNEANNATSSEATAPVTVVERRTIWRGRRIMNFLLACMLLAFVISWLFHFKLLS